MNTGNRNKKWIALFIFSVVLLAGPLLVRDEYLHHIAIMVFINVALAESLWIMMQAGESSFGHSAFAAVGGYCTAMLAVKLNVDPWFTFVIGGIGAAIVGILLGLIISHLSGVFFVICTFAFMELTRALLTNSVSLGGAAGIPGIPTPAGLNVMFGSRSAGFYYLALGVMGITILAVLAITRSRLILLFNATEHNRILSSSLGIYVRKYKLQAFAIGCFFAGLSGAVLASYLTHIAPINFGFLTSLDIVLSCYIGGIGNWFGPVVGAAVMTYLTYALMPMGYYKMIIYGGILVVGILFLREGLVSLPRIVSKIALRWTGKK